MSHAPVIPTVTPSLLCRRSSMVNRKTTSNAKGRGQSRAGTAGLGHYELSVPAEPGTPPAANIGDGEVRRRSEPKEHTYPSCCGNPHSDEADDATK